MRVSTYHSRASLATIAVTVCCGDGTISALVFGIVIDGRPVDSGDGGPID
jgi:hypothetical protein